MSQGKYYSPRLTRSLISPLYHAAKAQRVPMTALASRLVAEGLERLGVPDEKRSAVAEEPARYDPSDGPH